MGNIQFKSWKEWIENEVDPEKKDLINRLNSAFKEAEFFLACASNYYELQLAIPNLHVMRGNNAGIDYDQRIIVIGDGLLGNFFINETDYDKNINHFLWIVAHEYFHYGRQHNVLKKLFKERGDKELKIRKYSQVLEDDADRLATAALYRHFQFNKHFGKENYAVKLEVLNALFLPIRRKISGTVEQNEFNNHHPVWSARLFSQVIKLSELDTRDVNVPLTQNSPTIEQQRSLTSKLLFLEQSSSEFQDNLFVGYIITGNCKRDLTALNKCSQEIYSLIYQNCKLPGLENPRRGWTPKISVTG